MTVHVSLRLVSFLVAFAAVLLRLPAPTIASVSVAQSAPTLAERLDRLAAEFDRNRIDLHVPGEAPAIVHGEEVIFGRGFGLADVEKKTPVTPDTAFFIGSTTKAFTATLAGILVDEGRMQWDDPVEKYLPEFKLKVQSSEPNDRANMGFGVTFEESPSGAVSATNFQRPGALPVMRLTPVASTLPTVDEITSSEAAGRAIFQVDRVEGGVTLAPETFVIK